VKNIPGIAWACITVAFVAVVGAFVVLTITGSDPTEFSRWLNSVANLAGILLGGGAVAFSAKAAQQTNGGLDERIKDAAKVATTEALNEQRRKDVAPGGELRR
jgi:ABC-type branched-subunit amino acid transport system permease subunit